MKTSTHKIRSLIVTLLFLFLISPTAVNAQAVTWYGTECVGGRFIGSTDATDVVTLRGIRCLFESALSVSLRIIGIATFIVIIIGGFKYLTSGGDAKNTDIAKQAITSGILGVVLAIVAFIILNIISKVTGLPLLDFVVGID